MSRDEYIDILFIDLKLTSVGKGNWLRAEFGKDFVDELTDLEKGIAITRLKKMKESAKIQKDFDY